MFKKIAFALAALTATASSATIPPKHPDKVLLAEVTLGAPDSANNVMMTYNGKAGVIGLTGCTNAWMPGDVFYLIVAPGAAVVVRKNLLDKALELTKGDWDVSIEVLAQDKLICEVVKN